VQLLPRALPAVRHPRQCRRHRTWTLVFLTKFQWRLRSLLVLHHGLRRVAECSGRTTGVWTAIRTIFLLTGISKAVHALRKFHEMFLGDMQDCYMLFLVTNGVLPTTAVLLIAGTPPHEFYVHSRLAVCGLPRDLSCWLARRI
jgi:hypothetical protein